MLKTCHVTLTTPTKGYSYPKASNWYFVPAYKISSQLSL